VRILLDITHPAHVHFFRNAIEDWTKRGNDVVIAARDKDIVTDLLDRTGLNYKNLGSAREGLAGLGLELLLRDGRLLKFARDRKPDVLAGIGGIFIAHVGFLLGIPSVVFTDTENATLSNRLTFPVATKIVTPRCYEGPVPGKKHVSYPGYHELAYTHPTRFEPSPTALEGFDLKPGDPYIVMRLVSWGAAHDVSDFGFSNLTDAVQSLQKYGRVLISSERPLPPELEPLRIVAHPELVHHLLYYARLFIGESATMASESATLGTPAILVSTSRRGYTNELESRYGLAFTFSDREGAQEKALKKASEILDSSNSDQTWNEKRNEMLDEMIDVTDFIVEVIESHGR
jgi:predicted glycosyltransferase